MYLYLNYSYVPLFFKCQKIVNFVNYINKHNLLNSEMSSNNNHNESIFYIRIQVNVNLINNLDN